MSWAFDNSYERLDTAFFTRIAPKPVTSPNLIIWNDALADELGLSQLDQAEKTAVFSGNQIPNGATPIAQKYAGHQFGQFNPELGDGRAHLLGEVIDINNIRRDITLKGSGPTPYSRGGDGRAWLGPVLREYIMSEAMHALGIPTTRSMAAVSTGETIFRETPLPGAILTRIAASHIRVGTFQWFAAIQDYDNLHALYEYSKERHAPNATSPDAFLEHVGKSQVKLIAKWMGVGFIHGVMNTDNCLISGETIDYGPCAFMDGFHPMRVFSSIDRTGRYAYGNQPNIIMWNLAQLATALVPIAKDHDESIDNFTLIINNLSNDFNLEWRCVFAAKIGIKNSTTEDDKLIQDLLALMAREQADFTNVFSALKTDNAIDQFVDREQFQEWHMRWKERIKNEPQPYNTMALANPDIIARNHRIEQVITAAQTGDFEPFHRLHNALKNPYHTKSEFNDFKKPPTSEEEVKATFCGT